MATTIICQAADCRWNKDGVCRADQIAVGPGPAVDCKIYEPAQAAPTDLRQQLAAGIGAGGAPGGMMGLPVPPGPVGPPRIPQGIY